MKKLMIFALIVTTCPILPSKSNEKSLLFYNDYDSFDFNFDENQDLPWLELNDSLNNSSNSPYNSTRSTEYQHKNIPHSLNLPDTTNSSDNSQLYFFSPIQFYPISYFEHLDEHGNLDLHYAINESNKIKKTYKEAKKAYNSRPEVKARRNLNAQIHRDKKRQSTELSNNASTLTPAHMKKKVYEETNDQAQAYNMSTLTPLQIMRKVYAETNDHDLAYKTYYKVYRQIPKNKEQKRMNKIIRRDTKKNQQALPSNNSSNTSCNSSEKESTNNKSQRDE